MILHTRLSDEAKQRLDSAAYFLAEPEARRILSDTNLYLGVRSIDNKGFALSSLFQKMVDVKLNKIYETFVIPKSMATGNSAIRVQELLLYDMPVLAATVGILYPELSLLDQNLSTEDLFMRSLLRVRADTERIMHNGASITPLLLAIKSRGVNGYKITVDEFIHHYAYAVTKAIYKNSQLGQRVSVDVVTPITKSLFEVPIPEVQIATVLALMDVAASQTSTSLLTEPLARVRRKFEMLDKQYFKFDKQQLVEALAKEKIDRLGALKDKLGEIA